MKKFLTFLLITAILTSSVFTGGVSALTPEQENVIDDILNLIIPGYGNIVFPSNTNFEWLLPANFTSPMTAEEFYSRLENSFEEGARVDGNNLVIYSRTRVSPIVDNNVIPTGYLITSATTDTRYRPFQAFNPNTIRGWQSSSHSYNLGIGSDYIQLQLPHARVVNRMALQNQREIIFDNRPDYNYGVVAPVSFILQGTNNYTSNGNVDWETLLTISSRYDTGISQATSYNINNTTAYRWYRLTVTRTTYNTSNNPVSIGQIGLWGMPEEETPVPLNPKLRNLSPNDTVSVTYDDDGNVGISVNGESGGGSGSSSDIGGGEDGEDEDEGGGFFGWLKRLVDAIISLPKRLIDFLADMLKSLFIPEDGYFRDKFGDIYNRLTLKIPIIGQIATLLSSLFDMFTDGDMPSFKVEIYGQRVGIIDFSMFDTIRPFIHGLIIFISYFYFIRRILRKLPKAIGGVEK